MPKNILFLEQFPNISGGQKVLLDILRGLDRNKYTPYVALPKRGELSGELDKLGIKYFVLPIGVYSAGRKSLFDMISYIAHSILLIPMCIWIIKNNKISLVYANAPRTYLWGTIAAKLSGVPMIWHLHSILHGLELKLCSILLSFGVKKVIAVSRSAAEPFNKNKDKIEIVYNGIDAAKYSNAEDRERMRAELNIPAGSKVIGFIGQISRWKGIEDYINAAALIAEQEQQAIFLVVGDVLFGEDLGYKEHIKKLAVDLGGAKSISFLGQRRDVPRLLSAIDIIVIPSIEPDPCPLVLLEAMASGKAIVASAHGGVAEIIENGVTGKLYPPGDHRKLAELLSLLLKEQGMIGELGKRANIKVTRDLTRSIFIKKINAVIDKAIF